MSAISTTFNLVDRMSAPLNNIISVMYDFCDVLDNAGSRLDSAFDSAVIDSAGRSLDQVGAQIREVADELARARQQQDQLSDAMNSGGGSIGGLINKIKGFAKESSLVQGIKVAANLSDEYVRATARLNLMNDGMQTSDELWQKLYASSQRSGTSFAENADVVAKLGICASDVFASNDEAIQFAENLNKMFIMAGAGQEEMSSAGLQLAEVLSSGTLSGEEFNAVFEAAPNVMQTIADSMGIPMSELQNLVSKGQITADTVKNALLGATDDINSQFENMPMTWTQIWQRIVNAAMYYSQPFLKLINWIANNFDMLAPVIGGVAAVLGVYAAYLGWIRISELASAASKIVMCLASYAYAAATGAEASSTAQATAAQYGFNTALLSCPLTWILLIIVAVIVAVITFCVWLNKTGRVSNTVFGMICGGINVALQFFKNLGLMAANIAIGIWNALGACAANIKIAFFNAISSVQSFFYNLLSTALIVIAGICEQLNKLPFVDIDYSGLIAKANEYADKAAAAANNKGEYEDVLNAFNTGASTFDVFADGWKEEAYNKGAAWGDEKWNSLMNNDLMSGLDMTAYDMAGTLADQADASAKTADNTAKIADNTSKSNEELKYLREIAERQVINKFTTAEIKVDMSGMQNSISSDMDIDGFVRKLEVELGDSMQRCAQGV